MKINKTILMLLTFSPFLAVSQSPSQIALWANGAPGFETKKNEREEAKDWWVKNIHNPSITVYLPQKEKATGAAVLICPGGGHRQLVITAEGNDPAAYFNSIGVAAFVLKYRLFREENSPYSFDKHVKEDAYRAMRLIRSKAKEWGIDSHRVGIMGFSAGGEVVSAIAYASGEGNASSTDGIDNLNGKPDFQILIYPGPLGIPETVPNDAPPAFLLAANDDACCSGPVITLLQKYHNTKVPVEAHIYAQGDHAFNMGNRSSLISIKSWPQRLTDWLTDNHYLNPSTKETGK